MRKQPLFLFFILFIFWLIISGEIDMQSIVAGLILALITVWFWQELGPRLPHKLGIRQFILFIRCLVLLVWYVINSNIAVAKTLLFANPRVSPVLLFINPPIKSNWGRVFLAACITVTPGTITVDIDPDTGQFIVHALTEKNAMDLFNWRIIDEIKKLETYSLRRK